MKKTTTIKYMEVELLCTGEYHESEKEQRYDNNLEGYKGTPSSFELLKVETVSGDDITGIFYEDMLSDLERLALDNLE